MQRLKSTALATSLLALAALLCACGSATPDSAAATAPAKAKRTVAVKAPAKLDTVAAVSVGKPGAAVDMRFDLGARPVVGQPLEVKIELTPRSAVGQLTAAVRGDDGLFVAGTGELAAADKPLVDTVLTRSVSVTPQREGMFYLSVLVETDANLARSFAIPVIVGEAGAVAATQKPATLADANNQRVERLPAQESSNPR